MTEKQRTGTSSKSSATKTSKATKRTPGKRTTYLERIHRFVKKTPMHMWLLFALAAGLLALDCIYSTLGSGVSLGMLYIAADNKRFSGRAEGNVYMKNGVIRGFTNPANPQTEAQLTQRANFGFLSGNWNALTFDQQNAWNAASMTVTDRFGRSVTVSGKTLYLALNRNLFNAGDLFIDTPPVPTSVAPPESLSLSSDLSSGHFILTFTPDPIPAGVAWLVFATAPQSPGTRKPGKSKFKLMVTLLAAQTSPVDLSSDYDALFGAPVVGQLVFTRVVAVKLASGLSSTPFQTFIDTVA